METQADLIVSQNGRQDTSGRSKWKEIGTSGIEVMAGLISQAYNAELEWPTVYPLYNRLRRSAPPIVITRQMYGTQAGSAQIEVVLPEDPTPAEKRLGELYESELENMDGGYYSWVDQYLAHVPFMGWGWWEVVPGMRSKSWRPPGDDDWRSEVDDGLIGVRRLAWRDHSSFDTWDMTDDTARLKGMWQLDIPNPRTLLPLDRSLHVTFGDSVNPEGLTPLEACWRLERIRYGLEIIQGIGYEHAAGYLDVRKTEPGELTGSDKSNIANAARHAQTAQEGNYVLWPFGFEGEIKDIPFSVAPDILKAINHYDMQMLQLYNMEWVAIATTAGTGSYNARVDGSSTWLMSFNNMWDGAVRQYDEQVGRMLHAWNAARFPGARRPHYVAKPLDKLVGLQELGQFWQVISQTMPLGDDDYIAIRTRSGILPETLPEPEEENEPMPQENEEPEMNEDELEPEPDNMADDEEQPGELAARPFVVGADETPDDVTAESVVSPSDVDRAVRKFRKWAGDNVPGLAALLDARVEDETEN